MASASDDQRPPWRKPAPKDAGKGPGLSDEWRAKARERAAAAGRAYPNLVDNMWASKMSKTAARAAGFAAGMTKAAAAARAIDSISDQVLGDLRAVSGDASVTGATRLDDLLPKGKTLEALITEQEHAFGVNLSDAVLARLFATGTADDLARALSAAAMSKTAAFGDHQRRQQSHQRYLQNRSQHLAASKIYRMQHMSQLRRQARSYRKKVKRKIHRPARRIGSSGGGYSFIPR